MVYHIQSYTEAFQSAKISVYTIPIANSKDDQNISTRYTDFVRAKRTLIHNGCSPEEVLGPNVMDPKRLVEDDPDYGDDSQSVCNWIMEIVRQFDRMCVAEK